jgi:hypothetical protein
MSDCIDEQLAGNNEVTDIEDLCNPQTGTNIFYLYTLLP